MKDYLMTSLPIEIDTRLYYVYAIIDPRNNKPFYIGKGKKNRYLDHSKETKENTSNIYKFNKIQKILKCNLTIEYLFLHFNIIDENMAYNIEKYYINLFGRKIDGGILTNICKNNIPPSRNGRIVSKETREKISKKQRGILNHRYGKTNSNESNILRRNFNIENNIKPPSNKNKKHTNFTKQKISISNTGKKRTDLQILSLKKRNSIWYIFNDTVTNKKITIQSYKLKELCKNNKLDYHQLLRRSRINKLYKNRYIVTKF